MKAMNGCVLPFDLYHIHFNLLLFSPLKKNGITKSYIALYNFKPPEIDFSGS